MAPLVSWTGRLQKVEVCTMLLNLPVRSKFRYFMPWCVVLCVRFDPDFVCNASDKRGRYSYQAQPSVCRWNLARLAEALGSELDAAQAGAVLDEFTPTYEALYLGIMRKKLGLVRREESEDSELVSDLLRLMHNTGTSDLWKEVGHTEAS